MSIELVLILKFLLIKSYVTEVMLCSKQGKMSQDDGGHIYFGDNGVSLQCHPGPKVTNVNSSRQGENLSSTWNDKDISKIISKFKVIFSIVAVLFILILAILGVLVSSAFGRNIHDKELKELYIEETQTLEKILIKSIADATSSLNQTGSDLMNIVKDNKKEIEMLRRGLNTLGATDCSKVDPSNYKSGNQNRGVFEITVSGQPIDAFCDLSTDSGNWTVIQRRMDGSMNFYRTHAEYVVGFGSLVREYWIGLQNLYNILQSSENFELRIDMEDWNGVRKFAKYSRFDIGPPQNDYVLSVSGYSGTAGDSLHAAHNGFGFSTKDHDVDGVPTANCAAIYKGAWWYAGCHQSNLNGLYHHGGPHDSFADGINWHSFRGYNYSLSFAEMKIKPTR